MKCTSGPYSPASSALPSSQSSSTTTMVTGIGAHRAAVSTARRHDGSFARSLRAGITTAAASYARRATVDITNDFPIHQKLNSVRNESTYASDAALSCAQLREALLRVSHRRE